MISKYIILPRQSRKKPLQARNSEEVRGGQGVVEGGANRAVSNHFYDGKKTEEDRVNEVR